MTIRHTLWRPAYIGLGGNLGNPVASLASACARLAKLPDTCCLRHASLYRSAPFGNVPQADFLNTVAALLTRLDARDLLRQLQAIERAAGRKQGGVRWGPRELDLDLLVYSNEIIDTSELIVPHPGIRDRNFVLLPLAELAPNLHIPGLGRVANLAVNTNEPRITRAN
ncbi:MAG TPA: 2-amino-4-hydroxy-6-hydroxymethyldihydropteridine diphosphokinase [Woeseiaceae bacterium]|nr:2-amino-4-hydroxy-6-hydroxymethyldihydropteridine diphosphokinase [Woeseiaceae bacterium]